MERMDRKKGDIRISYLIGGIIAVFVLVMAIYFLFFFGGGLSRFLELIIPGFNETKQGVEGIEIFRYNIPGENVMHYDGTKWTDFEEVIVNGKTINAGDLTKNFRDFYFQKRGEKSIDMNYLIENFYQIMKDDSGKTLSQDKIDYIIKKSMSETGGNKQETRINAKIKEEDISYTGNVLVGLVDSNSGKTINYGGYFVLRLNNTMEFWYKAKFYITGGEQIEKDEHIIVSHPDGSSVGSIYNAAKDWRDAIFEKPISINYKNSAKKSCAGSYEAELKDSRYIVVDLGKSIGGEICP